MSAGGLPRSTVSQATTDERRHDRSGEQRAHQNVYLKYMVVIRSWLLVSSRNT